MNSFIENDLEFSFDPRWDLRATLTSDSNKIRYYRSEKRTQQFRKHENEKFLREER